MSEVAGQASPINHSTQNALSAAQIRSTTLTLLDQLKVAPASEWRTTITSSGFRPRLNEAQLICERLRSHSPERFGTVSPLDFPSAIGLIGARSESGLFYQQLCTHRFLIKLGEIEKVDIYTPLGFRKILEKVTARAMESMPLNEFGSTAISAIKFYGGSPYKALTDLLQHEEKFAVVQKIGILPFDLQNASHNTWGTKNAPSPLALHATELYLRALALRYFYKSKLKTPEDFQKPVRFTKKVFRAILPHISTRTFIEQPVTFWGTTLEGLVSSRTFGGSCTKAVLTCIKHRPAFKRIKDSGIAEYDFPTVPFRTWSNGRGQPTENARKATRLLLEQIAREKGINPYTPVGLKELLEHVKLKDFQCRRITTWGTTLPVMLRQAYGSSPGRAIQDLLKQDLAFNECRRVRVGRALTRVRKAASQARYANQSVHR